ncbi:MAG: ABC transporter ATP-binding protein [Patescibacteria group bacterium]
MKKNQKLHVRETLVIYGRHVLKYRTSAIVLILVILGAAGASMIPPLVVQRMIDEFAKIDGVNSGFWFAFKRILELLGYWIIAWTLWRISGFLATGIQPRIRTDLERTALDALQRQSHRFFTDEFTGALVRRVRGFANAYIDIAESILWRFVPLVVELSFIFVIFVRLHILFLPALIIWFALMVAKSIFFARRRSVLDLERAAKDSKVTGVLSDVITNNLNVKLFTATQHERENFFNVTEERQVVALQTWRFGERVLVLQNIISAAFMLTMLGILAWLWSRNVVGLGIFAAAVLYFNRLNRSMDDVGNAMRRIYEALAEAAEMTEIILLRPEVQNKRGAKELRISKAKIEFQNVSFIYSDGREALDSFDLVINSKEKVALVGPSGAG